MQFGAIFAQPGLRFRRFFRSDEVVDETPEAPAVVHFPEMSDFMRAHIVQHESRGHDKAPGYRYGARGGA